MLRIPTVPVVPLFPHQRIEDLVQRIEQLVMDAHSRGFGTLAYFLEIALTEAHIQQRELLSKRPDSSEHRQE